MKITTLFKYLRPFVTPYRPLIIGTLVLTLVGSLTAQINAWVLRYTVDEITFLTTQDDPFSLGMRVLIIISSILLGKEILNAFIVFGQKYYGEKLRILVSKDLAQHIVDKILTYRMAFFTSQNNESGKLQTRIDRGIESLTRLV